MSSEALVSEALNSEALYAEASARRDAAFGATLTFSPKVFLPLTNLCRNACTYCSFRRSPGDPGEWTMHPDEVAAVLDDGARAGCTEALFCLGDTPDGSFPEYHALLRSWGHASTVDYLVAAGRMALERGLLPHTNAGILTAEEMSRLAAVNVSLGLMLETTSERLCRADGPHARAPDKRPARRLAMIEDAGRHHIPFTSGILVGIGETEDERIETLVALRDSHRRWGHLQEVIVQPFREGPRSSGEEPTDEAVRRAVALARVILDPEVSVQSPPNLVPGALAPLLAAGLNDLGGISPLTPDFINPSHPWPMLDGLARESAAAGRTLRPRLPVYPRYIHTPGWLADGLGEAVASAPRAWARLGLSGVAA